MTEDTLISVVAVLLISLAAGAVMIPILRRLERHRYTDTIVAWSNEMLRLRAALRFYAENLNYEDGHEGTGPYGDSQGGIVDTEPPSIWNDHGEIARNILAEPFAADKKPVSNPKEPLGGWPKSQDFVAWAEAMRQRKEQES